MKQVRRQIKARERQEMSEHTGGPRPGRVPRGGGVSRLVQISVLLEMAIADAHPDVLHFAVCLTYPDVGDGHGDGE